MSGEKLHIRPVLNEDCDVLHQLLKDLAVATGLPGKVVSSANDMRQTLFSENSFLHAVIAEFGEKPVGFCLYYPIYSSWRGESGVYVLDLYLDSSLRGQGGGAAMVSHVAKDARQRWQANFMHLDVDKENDLGFMFYKKMGFENNQDDNKMVALSAVYETFL